MTTELGKYLQETLKVSPSQQGALEIHPLAGDASSRRYSRIQSGLHSWVLMEWEPFDPESYSLLSVQKHLKKNHVLVPEVVAASGELGIILYEDLGDITLEQEFFKTRNPYGVLGYYRMAVDELLKIHLQASQDKSPCIAFDLAFDVEKLSWEMNFTRTHFFEGILKFKDCSQELNREFHQLTTLLHEQPKYIQHRDYHSRNIMVYQNKVRVIDFQDARMGIVQYDLCSLFKDAYVPFPESLETELLDYYLYRAQSDYGVEWPREEFQYLYEVQSIQRLFKAIGSFASFWMLRKDQRYLKYIPPTLAKIKKSLIKISEYPVLKRCLDESGAYEWAEEKL